MAAVEEVAVTMARTLRGLGVPAPPDATVAYATALAEVGIDRRSSAYWAGRATLVRRPEDVPAYDRAFAAVFEGRPDGRQAAVAPSAADGSPPRADRRGRHAPPIAAHRR